MSNENQSTNEKNPQKKSWKDKLKDFCTFVRVRQVGIMLTLMMLFLCFVMLSWGVAFWANGLYDTHFDLGSCWQGITVVATGLGTVATFAAMPYIRYWISSKWNSGEGEIPEDNPFAKK